MTVIATALCSRSVVSVVFASNTDREERSFLDGFDRVIMNKESTICYMYRKKRAQQIRS
jgi:hypothetical protein